MRKWHVPHVFSYSILCLYAIYQQTSAARCRCGDTDGTSPRPNVQKSPSIQISMDCGFEISKSGLKAYGTKDDHEC